MNREGIGDKVVKIGSHDNPVRRFREEISKNAITIAWLLAFHLALEKGVSRLFMVAIASAIELRIKAGQLTDSEARDAESLRGGPRFQRETVEIFCFIDLSQPDICHFATGRDSRRSRHTSAENEAKRTVRPLAVLVEKLREKPVFRNDQSLVGNHIVSSSGSQGTSLISRDVWVTTSLGPQPAQDEIDPKGNAALARRKQRRPDRFKLIYSETLVFRACPVSPCTCAGGCPMRVVTGARKH